MPRLSRSGRAVLLIGLAVSLGMGLFYVFSPAILPYLDYKVYDVFLTELPHSQPSGQVAVLDVDEPSLAQYGQWPWPRYRVALLLAQLQKLKPAAVALDMVFAEPDRTSPAVMQKELKRDLKVELEFSGLPQGLMDYDPILAGVLAKGPFVLGYNFLFQGQPQGQENAPPKPLKLAWLKDAEAPEPDLFMAKAVVRNLPILGQAAPFGGYFNTISDRDGVLRSIPLIIRQGDKVYPSLALAALMQAQGAEQAAARLGSGGLEAIKSGRYVIPLGSKATMLVRFRGGLRTIKYISAARVLNGEVSPQEVQGKVIFMGTSAGGLKDLRTTPLASAFPGVEVHAAAVDNIIQGDYLHRPSWAPGLELLATLAAGLISSLLFAYSRAVWSLVWGVGLGLGIWYGAAYYMRLSGLFLSPLVPILALTLNFVCLSLVKFWREERRKRFFRRAFAHYVAPAVVERLAHSPGQLSLQGEEREATILFSDIRNFTSITESLKPQEVTRLLQAHFTPAVKAITEHGGTLDKFMGDGIMAFWNAPLDTPGHPIQAVEAALEITDTIHQVNRELDGVMALELKVGVGLASGQVYVGNMGTDRLFNYSALGDTVNLASRLEGLTKFYKVDLVVNEAVARAAGHSFKFQALDRVRVKGKKEPVTIYTAYTLAGAEELKQELELHHQAWQSFWAMDFSQAELGFEELSAKHARLPVYEQFLAASKRFQKTPPQSEDELVFNHLTK